MMTINALCLFSLPAFLDQMVSWKQRYGRKAPTWSANILRFPSFMSPLVLPDDIRAERAAVLRDWIGANRSQASSYEIDHIQRGVDYIEVVERPHDAATDEQALRRDLKSFHRQYDARRGKTVAVFPPIFTEWLSSIDDTNLEIVQPLIDGSPIG
jgi:hypothetical protein